MSVLEYQFGQLDEVLEPYNFGAFVDGGSGGDPSFANVTALLHFEGADGATAFTDVKGHTVTRIGLSTLETTDPLWGVSSMKNPDINSGCVISHDDMRLLTGEWTIEGWFTLDVIPPLNPGEGYGILAQVGASLADATAVTIFASENFDPIEGFGSISVDLPGSSSLNSDDNAIQVGVKTHIAVTKNASNVCKLWIQGVEIDDTINANAPTNVGAKFSVGCWADASPDSGTIGRFDEWRLTPGVCRYTAPFTPEAPYPDA